MPKTATTLLLDDEMFTKLDEIAELEGISRGQVIRETLSMAIDHRRKLTDDKFKKLKLAED